MAYADFAAYKAQYKTPNAMHHWWHIATVASNANWPLTTMWAVSTNNTFPIPQGGAIATAPTTAAACDASTAGAWVRPKAGSGDQVVVAAHLAPREAGAAILICDRLSHQGGLDGTVTTTQTTNLPTAALTRYTSGVGVIAALEVYSGLGTVDTTMTVSYTNQAGTAGRSSPIFVANTPGTAAFIPVPLIGNDTGVKSVESVALTPSTTAAGNFGVTLFKPLLWIPASNGPLGRPIDIFEMPGWNEPILDDACLFAVLKIGLTSNVNFDVTLSLGES